MINFKNFIYMMLIHKVFGLTIDKYNDNDTPKLYYLNSTIHDETNSTIQDDLKQRLESLRDIVNLYYLPLIVSIGLIGNILTLLIFTFENNLATIYDSSLSFRKNLEILYQKQISKQENQFKNYNKPKKIVHLAASNYFIVFLAISDLIYNFILACVWITRLGLNILNIKYICQISVMISYICSFLSAAFTTLFTFQRFMAVVNPLESTNNFLHSKKVIIKLTLVLILFSFIVYSFSLYVYDTSPKKDHEVSQALEVCGVNEKYSNLVYTIDNTVDSFLTLIIPAIGIICMNLAICKSLSNYQKTNLFKNNGESKTSSLKKASVISLKPNTQSTSKYSLETETLELKLASTTDLTHFKNNNNNNNNNLAGKKKPCVKDANASRHVTKMLLIVSFAFLLLNSPFRLSKLFSYINMLIKKNYVYSNIDF
ncbi:unnamed protein product, partial [Brachionus calyciflorus]